MRSLIQFGHSGSICGPSSNSFPQSGQRCFIGNPRHSPATSRVGGVCFRGTRGIRRRHNRSRCRLSHPYGPFSEEDLATRQSRANWEPTNANSIGCHGNHRPGVQFGTGHGQHSLKDCRQRFTLETFDSDAHNGRADGTRRGQQCMEVGIQCDDNGMPPACGFQDLGVGCHCHAQVADVFRRSPPFGQMPNRARGQALIQ